MRTFQLIRILNIIAAIIIVFLAVFILLRPFIPDIVLAMGANEFEGYAYLSDATLAKFGEKAAELPQIPEENMLVVPKIYVNSKINEGPDDATLDLGMWRRPHTSRPDKGGNTVITAHRFLYTRGPDTFYHLDKIEIDDVILVYWQGKEYVYKVFEIIEVFPDQVEVEYNTKDPIITLYTCEPLWTSEKRLVVKGRLQ